MANVWQEAYSELTDFITKHSEVEVEPSVVKIPENVRPEFYRLFNAARKALIEEKCPGLLSEAMTLSQNYLKAEEEVIKLLGLDSVTQPKPLHWFLQDPADGLIRELFNPLFDLLKGRIDTQTFEAESSQSVKNSSVIFSRAGYEKWMALSLIKLLEADKLFQVILRRPDRSEWTIIRANASDEKIPPPQELKQLSFDRTQEELLAIPDFIVHSAKADRYIASRSEINRAIATASNASEQREWYPLASVAALAPGLTLIYAADTPEEISLVADAKKICRPDLIIECKEQKDWFETGGLDKVKFHHTTLKPRLGTYIVSRETVPEQALAELGEGIRLLTVDFDAGKLSPVVDALMKVSQSEAGAV